MDGELVYTSVFVIIFVLIAIKVMRGDGLSDTNTKEQKRALILQGYRKKLREELSQLENDKKLRTIRKKELLKKFSDELASNIFFEQVEIKKIIFDLAEEC